MRPAYCEDQLCSKRHARKLQIFLFMFFSFFFCFVLSLFQDEKNPTLIHYLVKNLPIPQILFYTLFVTLCGVNHENF